MKRIFVFVSGLFVLGELIYRVGDRLGIGVIFGITCVIAVILSSIFKRLFKSLNLLLFLSLPLGCLWGYGFFYDGNVLAGLAKTEAEVEMKAYISGLEETSMGARLIMECDDGSFIMYVKQDKEEAYHADSYIVSEKNSYRVSEKNSYGVPKKNSYGVSKKNVLSKIENSKLQPGRYVTVKGTFKRLRGLTNPGGLDLEEYYLGRGIECELKPTKISIDYSRKNYLTFYLWKVRRRVGESIDSIFDEEDAAILRTMILGDKSDLDTDTKLLFQRSGIAHVLAISGLHVGLLAGVISLLLSLLRIRKKTADIISILIIILYGLMTGFSPATLRAVIMITVYKLAFVCGRTADMPTSMMEALLIMLIINPDSLFSIGLHMSFAAVIGVFTGMSFYNVIFGKERFLGLPIRMRKYAKKLIGGFLVALSINLWMTPLVIRSYYEVPLYSILLNFMIIPLLTFVIIFGSLAALMGIIFSVAFGMIFKYPCCLILDFYKLMCRLFLKLPGSVVMTGHVELWQLAAYYLAVIVFLITLFLLFKKSSESKGSRRKVGITMARRYATLLVGFISLMFIFIFSVKLWNNSRFSVTFLDVGQGDGSLIHTGKRNYIIDAGSSDNNSVGQYTLIPALKYYGMQKVDMIFISHTDTDHVSGIIYLLENKEKYGIEVGGVVFAKGTEKDEVYTHIASLVGEEKVHELSFGDRVEDDFVALYPREEDVDNKKLEHGGNDYSLVLYFTSKEGKLQILYTGDISSEVEGVVINDMAEVIAEDITDDVTEDVYGSKDKAERNKTDNTSIILKCAHHGSKYSSSEEFLEKINPDITVISCGEHNMYGHPSTETLQRLDDIETRVLRTDKDGAVLID